MRIMQFAALADLAADPANGWSIGCFGAIGEFMRTAGEPTTIIRNKTRIEISTAKGAMRLVDNSLRALAWDSLSSDGRGWNHNLALCAPLLDASAGTVTALGRDRDAISADHADDLLFDLGVARGLIRMCVRTSDAALNAALFDASGTSLLSSAKLVSAIIAAQPNRVMLSPFGRLEVFQPIPEAHQMSPEGPHTHLLPQLIKSGRLHSANDPIPDGWQAVLNVHPPPPWTGGRGNRKLDRVNDNSFQSLLQDYGDLGEADLEERLRSCIGTGKKPSEFSWPSDRRKRAKARLVLRRLEMAGCRHAAVWRKRFDPCRTGQACATF